MPKLVIGINDLETWCKSNEGMEYLLDEWNKEQNIIMPNMVSCKSSSKAWWKCRKCGHVWAARISDRTSHKSGCPSCNYFRQTSQHEQTFYYYVKNEFPDAISAYRAPFLGKREIDIFIPSLSLGIEYDGRAWHGDPKKDYTKSELLRENGITLIRIREDNTELSDGSIYLHVSEKATSSDTRYLKDTIEELFEIIRSKYNLNCYPDIDIDRDNPQIVSSIELTRKEGSLETLFPQIAAEWDFEKNAPLNPDFVKAKSKRRYWWVCSSNHHYIMAVCSRTCAGQSCPYCSGRKVLTGFNDLAFKNPELASEWDSEKNGTLTPSDVTWCSGKRVWWRCKVCGRQWVSSVNNRAYGNGCPDCAKIIMSQKVGGSRNPMFGCTGKDNPHSIPICSYTQDGMLVGEYSSAAEASRKEGYHYSSISSCIRGINKTAGGLLWRKREDVLDESSRVKQSIDVERKDLEYVLPEIIGYWDWNKNGDLAPNKLAKSSSKMIWLRCDKGHEWKDKVSLLTQAGRIKCPECKKAMPNIGIDDFATLFPELLEEWDYDLNTCPPHELFPNSKQKVAWRCTKGHRWKDTIFMRTHGMGGCPICTRRKLFPGVNDLATLSPALASEWDSEQNEKTPADYCFRSTQQAWWICPQGHRWQARINERFRGKNCTVCEGKGPTRRSCVRTLIKKNNDLKTVCPELAAEWDYNLNEKGPEEYVRGSCSIVGWKCPLGHTWQASISQRVNTKTGCPFCKNRRVWPGFNDLQSKNPKICEDWDYDRNEDSPQTVLFGSHREVWWKCHKCGCEWKSRVGSRTKQGQGCPRCAKFNKKAKSSAIPGQLSLRFEEDSVNYE